MGCPFESATLILKGGKIPAYLDMSVMEQIDQIDGIQIAAPSLMHGLIRPEEGRTDIFLGIDERMLTLKNWWKIKGSFFKKNNDIILLQCRPGGTGRSRRPDLSSRIRQDL